MTRCDSAVCSLLPRASDITLPRPWKWQHSASTNAKRPAVLSEPQPIPQATLKVVFFLLIYLDRSVYCRGGGRFRKKPFQLSVYASHARPPRRVVSLQALQSELEPPSPPSSPCTAKLASLQALSLSSFLSNSHSLFTFCVFALCILARAI